MGNKCDDGCGYSKQAEKDDAVFAAVVTLCLVALLAGATVLEWWP